MGIMNLLSGGGIEASRRMVEAIQEAIAYQKKQNGIAQERLKPFAAVGKRVLPEWEDLKNQVPEAPDVENFHKKFGRDGEELRKTPGFQFAEEQGQRQLDRLAGKKGYRGSGNRLLDAVQWGQGLASQLYDKEYARGLNSMLTQYGVETDEFGRKSNTLGNQVQLGFSATEDLANLDQNLGNNVSSLTIAKGQAYAAESIAKAVAQQNAIKVIAKGVETVASIAGGAAAGGGAGAGAAGGAGAGAGAGGGAGAGAAAGGSSFGGGTFQGGYSQVQSYFGGGGGGGGSGGGGGGDASGGVGGVGFDGPNIASGLLSSIQAPQQYYGGGIGA